MDKPSKLPSKSYKTVQHSVLKTPKRLEFLDLIIKTLYAFLPFRISYLLRNCVNVPEVPRVPCYGHLQVFPFKVRNTHTLRSSNSRTSKRLAVTTATRHCLNDIWIHRSQNISKSFLPFSVQSSCRDCPKPPPPLPQSSGLYWSDTDFHRS